MENGSVSINKKPFYKKWWFWVVSVVIVLGAIGFALIKTGSVDAGVNVHLENNKNTSVYESKVYLQNNEFKIKYELEDFKYSYKKTRVDDDGYVYYDVTLNYNLSCQLSFNNKNYNDDTIDFTPCIVFYSTNNSNFKKVIKTMTVHSGHEYDFSYKIEDVCGGKEKEFASFEYYVKVSVPANE